MLSSNPLPERVLQLYWLVDEPQCRTMQEIVGAKCFQELQAKAYKQIIASVGLLSLSQALYTFFSNKAASCMALHLHSSPISAKLL